MHGPLARNELLRGRANSEHVMEAACGRQARAGTAWPWADASAGLCGRRACPSKFPPWSGNVSSLLFSWTLAVRLRIDTPFLQSPGASFHGPPCSCGSPPRSLVSSRPAWGAAHLRLGSSPVLVLWWLFLGFLSGGLLFSPCCVRDVPSTRGPRLPPAFGDSPVTSATSPGSPAPLSSCS